MLLLAAGAGSRWDAVRRHHALSPRAAQASSSKNKVMLLCIGASFKCLTDHMSVSSLVLTGITGGQAKGTAWAYPHQSCYQPAPGSVRYIKETCAANNSYTT